MLQWSHNNSVVETLRKHNKPEWKPKASMEPQQFSCGNDNVSLSLNDLVLLSFNGATTIQLWKLSS